MFDSAANASHASVLGEINCSCVGFTTHLEHRIQKAIVAEIIRHVRRAGAPSPA